MSGVALGSLVNKRDRRQHKENGLSFVHILVVLSQRCVFFSLARSNQPLGMVRITVTITGPVEPTRHSWLETIRAPSPPALYDPQSPTASCIIPLVLGNCYLLLTVARISRCIEKRFRRPGLIRRVSQGRVADGGTDRR